MVFYYQIRGGQCLNSSSRITLTSDDIVCYVGRDKHENEHLIKYGWPGDVWFHVDGLSSAHVYFRLRNTDSTGVSSIPLDDLPEESVYDMLQICKHNSIQGGKLASCKMVYTPHSNLKKTFDMASGAVTYHNPKNCRYRRCDKDRARVKQLEKTKSEDVEVDYYAEMKANERRIIERKKRQRQQEEGGMMYDPLQEDADKARLRATRQGDDESGLDSGLAALEGLGLSPAAAVDRGTAGGAGSPSDEEGDDDEDSEPQWVRDGQRRALEASDDVRFLRERGYSASEAAEACRRAEAATGSCAPKLAALRRLYHAMDTNDADSSSSADIPDPEGIAVARQEEKEVLLAMFGGEEEDDDDENAATFADVANAGSLDAALPGAGYDPPGRYGRPPPLMLEVYVDGGMAPAYPHGSPPVLALRGHRRVIDVHHVDEHRRCVR